MMERLKGKRSPPSPRFQATLGKGNGAPNRKQKRFPRFRPVSPWQRKKARGERAGVFFWLISPFHVDVRNPPSHGSLFDSTLHEVRRPDDESIITQIAKGIAARDPSFPYILSSSKKRKKKRERERDSWKIGRPIFHEARGVAKDKGRFFLGFFDSKRGARGRKIGSRNDKRRLRGLSGDNSVEILSVPWVDTFLGKEGRDHERYHHVLKRNVELFQ